MALVFVLPAAMAAIAIFVGVWHLLVYVRGLREREQLYFALACFAIGMYDACAAGAYATTEPAASAFWQRGQHLAVALFSPAFLWFVLSYTRQRMQAFATVVTAYYLVHAAAVAVVWNDWVLTPQPHPKLVSLPWGTEITYFEMHQGVLLEANGWISLPLIAVVVGLVLRYVWIAPPEQRRRAVQLAAGTLVFLAGGVNDTFVGKGLLQAPYLMEYAFLGLILVMTYAMSSAVLDAARARAELKRSHERLRNIFASVQDVYAETTWDGTILEISPSVSRFPGFDRDGLIGRSMRELYADPGRRDAYLAQLQEHGYVKDFEIDVRLPTGQIVNTEFNSRLVDNGGNEQPRIVSSIRDITERKRVQTERAQLEQQMAHAQKLESLGVLAGGVAHDFNNLLTGVLGSADLARYELSPDHPVQEQLGIICDASQRATELCRQMLAYSGRGQLRVEPLDLSRLVSDMGGLLRVSVAKRARLELQLAENLPAVQGDAVQLRQVLLNLVVNASEAMGEANSRIGIATGVRHCDHAGLQSSYLREALPEGDYVYLEVSDAGCGMDAETQQRLFDPFFTTKFAGRGLGLAAVLGIVRGHRGSIRVCSEPGQGSSFQVLLPVSDQRVESRPDVRTSQWQGAGLVLLADDEAAVRAVADGMLQRLGFQVRTVQGGEAAVAAFREEPNAFALVILDVTMPDLSGDQVFRKLREIRPGVRVLLASGYSEHEIFQRYAGEGLVGFVQKPFSLEDLRAKLRAVLG